MVMRKRRLKQDTDTEADTEQNTVTNVTGVPPIVDSDKQFWDGAKAYLGKSKASKIGSGSGTMAGIAPPPPLLRLKLSEPSIQSATSKLS
jgi:hypothetical protein